MKKKDPVGVKSRPAGVGGLLPPPPGAKSGGLLSPLPDSAPQTAPPAQQSTGTIQKGTCMIKACPLTVQSNELIINLLIIKRINKRSLSIHMNVKYYIQYFNVFF